MYREVTEVQTQPMPALTVVEDTNRFIGGTRQGLSFRHGLGRVPLIIQIQFSPDPSFDDVHILQWRYEHSNSFGPVSLRADTQFVYLEFTNVPALGTWKHAPPQWTTFNEGYFRVIVF